MLSTKALASRTSKLFPFDTPAGWTLDAPTTNPGQKMAPCWAGLYRKVDFVNLSAIPQTVTLRAKNIKLAFGTCNPGPGIGGNWVQSAISTTCWDAIVTVPDWETPLTIPANSTASATVNVLCQTQLNGVTGCSSAANPTPATQVTTLANLVSDIAETTMEVVIAEDRGAVLANVVGAGSSLCMDFRAASRFNIPFNGGRPF